MKLSEAIKSVDLGEWRNIIQILLELAKDCECSEAGLEVLGLKEKNAHEGNT